MDVVPLLGAIVGTIVVCYGWGRGPTLGEWTWCHCWVPFQGAIVVCYGGGRGRVTTNFAGVDVVQLQGAIVVCHCRVLWLGGRVTTLTLG